MEFPDTVDKAAWRAWAADRASAIDADSLSPQLVRHLEEWVKPHAALLVFSPMRGEPDLSGLTHRGPVFVTRTPDKGPLTIHDADAPRERHRWGYLQPVAGTAEVDPGEVDVALVPGALFAEDGARLGHGKGYYDRLLSSMRPGIDRVGVTFDRLVVPTLPSEAHDVAMTHLATESGVRPTSLTQ